MIMAVLALASFVVCSFGLVALVITGGPGVWVATFLMAAWLVGRAWRWLDEPVSSSVDAVFPATERGR
jgi:hypothetical protein